MTNQLLSYDDVRITAPARVNPHLATTTPAVEDFCRLHHIWLPHFDGYHTMAAYLFPRTCAERLRALNILMDLIWFVDDSFDGLRVSADGYDQRQTADQILHATGALFLTGQAPADTPPLPWFPAVKALHHDFVDLNGADWLNLMAQTLEDYLQSITSTLDDLDERERPTVEAYIDLRLQDSGMLVALDCTEFAYDMRLPQQVRHDPTVREARKLAGHIGGLMNDLMSYHIDEQAGNRFNLIAVLCDERALPVPEGIDAAVRIVNGFIERFDACEAAILSDAALMAHPETALYVEGLRDQLEASWHWQVETSRYRSQSAYFDRLRAG